MNQTRNDMMVTRNDPDSISNKDQSILDNQWALQYFKKINQTGNKFNKDSPITEPFRNADTQFSIGQSIFNQSNIKKTEINCMTDPQKYEHAIDLLNQIASESLQAENEENLLTFTQEHQIKNFRNNFPKTQNYDEQRNKTAMAAYNRTMMSQNTTQLTRNNTQESISTVQSIKDKEYLLNLNETSQEFTFHKIPLKTFQENSSDHYQIFNKFQQNLKSNQNQVYQVFGKKDTQDLAKKKFQQSNGFQSKIQQFVTQKDNQKIPKLRFISKDNTLNLQEAAKFRKRDIQIRQQNILDQFKLYDQLNPKSPIKNQLSQRSQTQLNQIFIEKQKQADFSAKKEEGKAQIEQTLQAYEKKLAQQLQQHSQNIGKLRNISENLIDRQIINANSSQDETKSNEKINNKNDKNTKKQDTDEVQIQNKKIKFLDIMQIVSNRIRILNQISKNSDGVDGIVQRKYIHRDQVANIDPIRQMKLRTQTGCDRNYVGNMLDYYNLKALQYSSRNDLVNAIEELHKGLTISPNNLNCRFTHGVIMFKLGLFSQARHDFEILMDLYPKELNVYFNYALVLLQLELYDKAIKIIKHLIEMSKNSTDFHLIYDAYLIEAQCNWRKNDPLEVINCFQNAQKSKQKLLKRVKVQQNMQKDLAKELLCWELRLMKNDIQEDNIKSLEHLSMSARVKSTFEYVTEHRQNEENYDFPITVPKGISKKLKQRKSSKKIQINLNLKNLDISNDNKPKQVKVNEQMIDIVDSFEYNQRGIKTQRQNGQLANLQSEKEIMKQFQLDQQKAKELALNKKFNKNVGTFYNQLKNTSLKHIDSNTQIRFDKVFACILQSQNNLQNQNDDFLQLFGDQLDDMTAEEFALVLKYHNSMKYTSESMLFSPDPENQEKEPQKIDAFSKFLMDQDEKNATVKVRELQGIPFNPNGVCEINKDQDILEEIMSDLQQKLKHVNQVINSELDKEDDKIFNVQLKNIDLTEYRTLFMQKNPKVQISSIEDKVIQKLKESLHSDNFVPYTILNALKQDLEQRQKMREIVKETQSFKVKRIEQKKIIMIRREFTMFFGSERNFQIIDLLLNRLKFFKNLDLNQRVQIYKKCDFLTLPPRHYIFNQGDVGNQMYIIIKGKVSVEQASETTGQIPIVIEYLADGLHFGELSLLDTEKMDLGKKNSMFAGEQEKRTYQTRRASCITAEETDLIVLDHKLAAAIYHGKRKSQDSMVEESNKHDDQEYLMKKVKALQEIIYFQDVEPRKLQNIAANIQTKTYSLGEFICKSGEIPEGLFIILKGQCRFVAQKISKRNLESSLSLTGKNTASKRDYHKLHVIDKAIFNFNPKTSVLNQDISSTSNFQNQVIYIDKMGKEIKKQREYIELITFSRMTVGNYFGARVLVPYEFYSGLKRIHFGDNAIENYHSVGKSQKEEKNEQHENYKSLLSVIADSSTVEVWIIDKKLMGYLSETELKRIYERIVLDNDADRPYHQQEIDYMNSQFNQFNNYSIQIAESFLYQRAMDKAMEKYRQ